MLRNIHRWMPGYVKNRIAKLGKQGFPDSPVHIFVSICDHYEPLWNKVDRAAGLKRVKEWCDRYPAIADKYRDSDGETPKYTFFYPIEEYWTECMDLLTDLCHRGYGEVEVHLHHDNDTSENLRNTLLSYKNILANKHDLLSKDKTTGEVRYGFIHGNWALNNSRPDGRWCGVDNEIEILRDTGCYADFTMPSAPDITQFPIVNSIYHEDGLLMVQGPLMFNWRNRKFGIAPRIENGFIGHKGRITLPRIRLWINANIHAKNRPDYIFIKLYTHGCQDDNLEYLLKGGGLDSLFSHFVNNFNDGTNYATHFVSAREMVNVIKSIEDGCVSDDINTLRDYKYVKYDKRQYNAPERVGEVTAVK